MKSTIRTITRWFMDDDKIIVIPNPKAAIFRESPGAASLYLNGLVKSLSQLRRWLLKHADFKSHRERDLSLEFLGKQAILLFEKFSNVLFTKEN